MVKFRLYWDKDAETKWLNEMAQQGWAMTSFFAGFYTFEECAKGKWSYQIDFGEKFGRCTEDYRDFMREAGIEIVQNWGYWIILRKPAAEGEFQLYTDVESSIEHYSKILRMFKVAGILEIICFFFELWGVLNGIGIALVYMFIILALMVAVINACVKTKNTIRELEARKTGIEAEKKSGPSTILTVGLLCNSGALIAMNSDTLSDATKTIVLFIAVVLVIIGVIKTVKDLAENK